jgi:hypothetical protein
LGVYPAQTRRRFYIDRPAAHWAGLWPASYRCEGASCRRPPGFVSEGDKVAISKDGASADFHRLQFFLSDQLVNVSAPDREEFTSLLDPDEQGKRFGFVHWCILAKSDVRKHMHGQDVGDKLF